MDCTLYLEIYANKTKWGMRRLLNIVLTKYISLLSFLLHPMHQKVTWMLPCIPGASPAWCTSSWEWGPPGAAVGGICHLLQWMVAREGEGSTGPSAAGRHGFASTLRDGLGNAQGATGMLWCVRRDKRLFPDCSFSVRVTCWSDIVGLFSCCLNTVGRKDGGRHLLARSYEQLC